MSLSRRLLFSNSQRNRVREYFRPLMSTTAAVIWDTQAMGCGGKGWSGSELERSGQGRQPDPGHWRVQLQGKLHSLTGYNGLLQRFMLMPVAVRVGGFTILMIVHTMGSRLCLMTADAVRSMAVIHGSDLSHVATVTNVTASHSKHLRPSQDGEGKKAEKFARTVRHDVRTDTSAVKSVQSRTDMGCLGWRFDCTAVSR